MSKTRRDNLPAPPEDPEAPLVNANPRIETFRTLWQYGAWQDLVDRGEGIDTDPDRAKLAAILAAAHSHLDAPEKAAAMARQALAWGIDRRLLARILLSAAQNSLARCAAALSEEAEARAHFDAAIQLVEPRAETALISRTRHIQEAARLGLLSDAATALDGSLEDLRRADTRGPAELAALNAGLAALRHQIHLQGKAPILALDASGSETAAPAEPGKTAASSPWPAPDEAITSNPRFDAIALSRLQSACTEGAAPVLYLDSKSLPRSGLHFLRNRLAELVGPGFSFCEWYQEPGCCRRMPCTLSPPPGPEGRLRLRLVKSHDFDGNDPIYPLGGTAQRIVMLRDPLYILTSWWVLSSLDRNARVLQEHGIGMKKINFMHESNVVARAHRIVAEHGDLGTPEQLSGFLREQAGYISAFVQKWCSIPASSQIAPRILCYSEVPQFIVSLLRPHAETLPEVQQSLLDRFETRIA